MLQKVLFQIAKSPFMGKIVGLAFQHCSRIIPVEKVYCDRNVLAFVHPQPCYENHIILSPRKAIRNLQQLSSERFCKYFAEIWQVAQKIHATRFAPDTPFVLMANGGKKQEVQQVHFHLFTNHEMVHSAPEQEMTVKFLYREELLSVAEYPDSHRISHFVLLPALPLCADNQNAVFKIVLQSIERLDAKFHMAKNGFSLIFQCSSGECSMSNPVFHIIADK